jgi:hypothetical protein
VLAGRGGYVTVGLGGAGKDGTLLGGPGGTLVNADRRSPRHLRGSARACAHVFEFCACESVLCVIASTLERRAVREMKLSETRQNMRFLIL